MTQSGREYKVASRDHACNDMLSGARLRAMSYHGPHLRAKQSGVAFAAGDAEASGSVALEAVNEPEAPLKSSIKSHL